jgi:hypothetical protein
VKLSAEFLILFVATIAVAGFVASQVVPMIAQQAQTVDAMVSGVALYSSKLIFVNVRNTGSVDITGVTATVYQKGSTTALGSCSTWPGATFPISPGTERGLQGTISSTTNPTAGQQYLVVVQVTFSGGTVKNYPVTVTCLSG